MLTSEKPFFGKSMSDSIASPSIQISKPPTVPPADMPDVRPARLWWLAALAVFFALSNFAFFPTITRIDPPGPGR